MGRNDADFTQNAVKTTAAAAAVATSIGPARGPKPRTVRIGVIYDLTGPFAAGGSVASSIGTQIAIDLVNEKGGIGGKYKIAPSTPTPRASPTSPSTRPNG